MMGLKKIRAGALQFVLFVGAIIAVLLMSFVLVSYTQVLFKKKTDVTLDLIQAAQTGLESSFKEPMQEGKPMEMSIQATSEMEVTVSKKTWGLLELREVMAKKGKLQFSKIGFVGKTIENRPALYLQDNQRPMVIAGKARIKGDAFLPQRGIKRGNIRGQGYTGSHLIYGKEEKSSSTLPQLDLELQSQLETLTQPFFQPKGETIRIQKGMILRQSFKEETKVIKGEFLELDKVTLSGNVVVWAAHKIIVHPSSQLKDVLLIAPQIEIKDQVSGNFQALASRTIKVGQACNLEYPTVLAVHQPKIGELDKNKRTPPNMTMDKGSTVRGMMVYQTKNEINKSMTHIHVAEKAMLIGSMLCQGNLELKGSVLGSVATQGFIALENGSAYQNHLFNGTIDFSALPQKFSGLPYQNEQPNSIVKWLY
ncbi:hypothetical protein [Flagellimonas algicola]|uniref:Cytoskeletal protein CcmA (Bactofilin family) n=1 Tax=Flagellimonas algicola TaxID=2583815 RepID=A0ABY2WLP9_9FLAO|nr:hypothetical protein [Allomuricauda algicola]TMU55653.1 hypothetical protein FGG15_15925 [Allomuricauda algicola]